LEFHAIGLNRENSDSAFFKISVSLVDLAEFRYVLPFQARPGIHIANLAVALRETPSRFAKASAERKTLSGMGIAVFMKAV